MRYVFLILVFTVIFYGCRKDRAPSVPEDPWENAWVGEWKVLYTYQNSGSSGPYFTSTGGTASSAVYSYQGGYATKIFGKRILDSQCMCLKWVNSSTQGNMAISARSRVENGKWRLTENFTFTDNSGVKDEWEDYVEFTYTEKLFYYNPSYRVIEVDGDILRYSVSYSSGGSNGGTWIERRGTLLKLK